MESCSVKSAWSAQRKRSLSGLAATAGHILNRDRVETYSALIVLTMSSLVKNQAGPGKLSLGGLWVFLGIRSLLQYAFEPDQNPGLFLKLQAGLPTGLNLYRNPPTVFPQGQSGYAHKAVACPSDASRFCVLRYFWPYIRGRDGPG